jgi:hypothetical protein
MLFVRSDKCYYEVDFLFDIIVLCALPFLVLLEAERFLLFVAVHEVRGSMGRVKIS